MVDWAEHFDIRAALSHHSPNVTQWRNALHEDQIFTVLVHESAMKPIFLIALWLLAANYLAYVAFAFDKRAAVARSWRISENTLLLLALAGGSIGSVIAQQRLRHKTVKEPFRSMLCMIIMSQIAVLATWLFRPDLIRSAIG